MNEVLITNWNSVIGKDDLVYHLGDFAFCYKRDLVKAVRDRLNGRIILVSGNHDRDKVFHGIDIEIIPMYKQRGIKIYPLCRIDHNGQQIMMCHYAMRTWDKSHYGVWHLYGHSHGNLADDPNSLSLDVGVDCHNFTPISFEMVAQIMATKKFKPIDHHGEEK